MAPPKKRRRLNKKKHSSFKINQLPPEILLMILEYDLSKSYLLVCKLWNSLLTRYHHFKHLTFYEKRRSENDMKLLEASQRKYKGVSFAFFREDDTYLEELEKLLIRMPEIQSVLLIFKYRGEFVGAEFLYAALKLIKEKQNVKICLLSPLGPYDVDQSIQFRNVQNLEIEYLSSADSKILNFFQDSSDVQSFQLFSHVDYDFATTTFLDYIISHKKSLKKVCLASTLDYCDFVWTGKFLLFGSFISTRQSRQIMEFLKDKIEAVENCGLFCCIQADLVSFIMDNMKSVEMFGLGGSTFRCIQQDYNFPKVKCLKLINFSLTREHITAISKMFPNLETLSLPLRNRRELAILRHRLNFEVNVISTTNLMDCGLEMSDFFAEFYSSNVLPGIINVED